MFENGKNGKKLLMGRKTWGDKISFGKREDSE